MGISKAFEGTDSRGTRYRREYKQIIRELKELQSDYRKYDTDATRSNREFTRARDKYEETKNRSDKSRMEKLERVWGDDFRKREKTKDEFNDKKRRAKYLYKWLTDRGVEGLRHY